MERKDSLVAAVVGWIAMTSTAAFAHEANLVFDGKAELFMPDIVSTRYSDVRAAVSPTAQPCYGAAPTGRADLAAGISG